MGGISRGLQGVTWPGHQRSLGLQRRPSRAPKGVHAWAKGDDSFKREGLSPGASLSSPQPAGLRATPLCLPSGRGPSREPQLRWKHVSEGGLPWGSGGSQGQTDIPSKHQPLSMSLGKTLPHNNFTFAPRILKMAIASDPLTNQRAHTFQEIILNEGNSVWTSLLIISLI